MDEMLKKVKKVIEKYSYIQEIMVTSISFLLERTVMDKNIF